MGDIQQVIRIKQIADVGEVLKGIDTIQKNLNKLALGPEAKASFDKLFTNIDRQIEKANKAKDSGFKNRKDVDDYNRAMDQIVANYTRIIEKINTLEAKGTPLAGKADEFKRVGEEVKNLGRELNKLKASFADIQKETAMGAKVASSDQKFQPKEWEKIRKNFTATKVDIDAVNEALTTLNKKYQEATARGWTEGNNAKEWENFKAGIDGVQSNLNRYTKSLDEQNQKQQQFNSAQTTFNTLLNEGKVALDAAGNAAKADAENIAKVAKEEGKAAKESQQLNSELEHFKTKAAYFFGIANGINLLKRALRSAFNTVKDLDAVMTETAVVTNFDVGDMWSQLPMYTQRANELGVSIHSAYEAATIFYQQGLKTNEVMAVSTETLKMARIAGLDAATASDRMTNALRGFNMEMDKTSAQRVNDVYSKLAAITASNTDEISTAMTKVASLAHNANMEFETTAAFLAQIIESTRESAETAGTALKTVVARFSEVKKLYSKGELMGEDEEGEEIDVNRVSTALRSAGISLNEYLTGAKGLDDIFIELAEKWDSLDIVQQRYIATMAAGSRQQSRFIALMSDYERTMQLVDAANNANGASQEQYGKTLESLQTKLARLKNAWDEFVLGLTNSNVIKGAVDMLTKLITAINDLIKKLSGKNAAVKMITTFFTAFAAFKVGRGLFNNTKLGAAFAALNPIAAKSGTGVASAFYSSLSDGIVKFSKGGGLPGAFKTAQGAISQKIRDFQSSNFSNVIALTPELRSKINSNLDQSLSTPEKWNELQTVLQRDTITTNELSGALYKSGQAYRLTEEEAKKLGLQVDKNTGQIGRSTAGLQAMATGALVAGSALTLLGDKLQDDGYEEFGTVIKGLGIGLIAFGTIMSVTLPLMAQVGAKGVSAAIISIPILGWIAAIISAVIALGTVIYSFAKNNSAEEKFKKASEAAKNAADAADEAREAYEKLGEAWENLEDKYKAIEDATKGTQEWRDAIREVNNAVLELANNYENVKFTRDKDGILRIENQKEIEDNYRTKTTETQAGAFASKIREYEAQENLRSKKSGQIIRHALSDAIDNGNIDDIIYGQDEELEALIEEKYAEYAKNRQYAPKELSDEMKNTAVKQLREEAISYSKNQELINSQTQALGSLMLENAGLTGDAFKRANSLVSNEYVTGSLQEKKDLYNKIAGYGSAGTKYIRNAYATNLGYKDWKDYKSKNEEEAKNLETEQMIDFIAGQDALKKSAEQLNAFSQKISQINDSDALALLGGQYGSGLTKEQLEKLSSEDYDIDKLYIELGGNDVFGENGKEVFTEWFNNSLEAAADNFDTSRFGSAFTARFNNDLTDNLKSGTYQQFAEKLGEVYMTSGAEGMRQVQQTIKQMTQDMKPDELDDFISSISEIDWKSTDSVKSLEELADEYGISEEVIKQLENQIVDFNKAVSEVDIEKLTTALGLAANIGRGEQGRSFSEEAYNTAIENGANKKDFKYNVATGNYDYVGKNLEDVTAAIIGKAREQLRGLYSQYNSAKAAQETKNVKGSIDTDKEEELKKFIGEYISRAGKDSIVDSAILNGDKGQLQNAYSKIIEQAFQVQDIEKDRDAVNDLIYQFNTGAENVTALRNSDDQYARDALIQQIVNTGLPEEFVKTLIDAVENVPVNASDANGYISTGGVMAGNIVDTIDKASAFGIDAQDLYDYVDALRTVEGLENARVDTLFALALANQQYQDGFKKIIDSYDDWIELQNEQGGLAPEAGNQEQMEIYEQLKKDLKEMLNFSGDISNEFMQMPETAELLKKAVDGDVQAVAQLRAELAKTQLGNLSTQAQEKISAQIDALTQEVPTLEFGASINDSQYAQDLLDMMMAAGATADQINSAFKTIGFTPPITGYEEVPYEDLAQNVQKANVKIVDPVTGAITEVTTDNVTDFKDAGVIKVPIFGDSKFVKPTMPSTKPKSSSSGGGGGSSKKKTYWENPYDELYNLQEKINEALRTREALERRYQKLLKQEQATLTDIRKSYYAQISNLHTEADLQKQFAAGRLRQINELGNKIYTDDEGNRKSFSSLGVTKYASYNAQTGLITIDWEGLDAISKDSSREKEGKAAEAYISKLEDLVSSYEEVRDKLWDIEDEIEKLREAAIDSYLSFEDRVMEAIVNSYQQQIDSYQSMSDAIDKANTEVIDSLQKQIDLSRQIRDNTEKEKDISDKENRLAYLQRDTSGANDLEIQKLEKELKDAREGYADTLIDQAIQNMQDDADTAAEQRARQIETMTEQLEIMKDTGALWQNVYELMNAAAEGDGALSPHSSLVKLLQETEAFASLSNIGQAKWWSEVAEEFHKAWIGLNEAEDKYKKDANNDGTIYDSGTQSAIEEVQQAPATQPAPTPAPTPTQSGYDEKTKYGVALAVCDGYWGNGETRKRNLESKGFNYSEIQGIVNKVIKDANSGAWYGKYYGIKDTSQYKMSKFKTGGLADFTGPAWLDGTKSKPELILNAQDSANFIALKDILASLLSVQGGRGIIGNGGDNYFDIDISASLGSDYDVDQLKEKIKRDIYNDGQYRNVNTINYLR